MTRIKTRRISFAYPAETLPRHYMDDDLIMSHVVAVLSSLFPEGEDFFVQSVRNYRDRITDPELKQQVAGFIGQEAIHGREHRTFNERLGAMGYPTHTIDRITHYGLIVGQKVLPKIHQLALTAALEHYTATLADTILRHPHGRDMLTHDEVRSLFLWHALEENEHKAVAFDVFRAVGGRERIRVGVMRATTVGFLAAIVVGTGFSMLMDRRTYHPRELWASVRRLRTWPFLTREIAAELRDYNRKGFHPNDHDTTALLDEWRTTLFGEAGTLTDRLPAAAAR